MEKKNPIDLQSLREDDLKAANAWVRELKALWGLRSSANHRWIEPAELFDFGDTLVFDIKTIRYIVTEAISYDQVQEWQEYVFWAVENDFDQPDLRDYMEASVPLVPREAQKRISEARSELMRLCAEERNKMAAASLDRQNMTRHLKD